MSQNKSSASDGDGMDESNGYLRFVTKKNRSSRRISRRERRMRDENIKQDAAQLGQQLAKMTAERSLDPSAPSANEPISEKKNDINTSKIDSSAGAENKEKEKEPKKINIAPSKDELFVANQLFGSSETLSEEGVLYPSNKALNNYNSEVDKLINKALEEEFGSSSREM